MNITGGTGGAVLQIRTAPILYKIAISSVKNVSAVFEVGLTREKCTFNDNNLVFSECVHYIYGY